MLFGDSPNEGVQSQKALVQLTLLLKHTLCDGGNLPGVGGDLLGDGGDLLGVGGDLIGDVFLHFLKHFFRSYFFVLQFFCILQKSCIFCCLQLFAVFLAVCC